MMTFQRLLFRVLAAFAYAVCVLAAAPMAAGAGPGQAEGSPAPAPTAPARLVAAGGVITEVIYALGREDLIAGVDSTSLYPPDALKTKANVGYMRALSSEGILSLHPTAVIAIDGAGPPDVLKAVEAAGVKIQFVHETPTPAGIETKITDIAAIVGEPEKGRALAASTTASLKALDAIRSRITAPKRALYILSLQNGRAMVGGRGTAADGIFALAGLANAAADLEGWKTISDEAILNAAPDVVIAMRQGPSQITREMLAAIPAFAATPAVKAGNIFVLDGPYVLSFGPRTPDAAKELMRTVYPGLFEARDGRG